MLREPQLPLTHPTAHPDMVSDTMPVRVSDTLLRTRNTPPGDDSSRAGHEIASPRSLRLSSAVCLEDRKEATDSQASKLLDRLSLQGTVGVWRVLQWRLVIGFV